MKKYTSEIKRIGREVTSGQSHKKRVQRYNKAGILIEGDRPSREQKYVIPYETLSSNY